MRGIADMLAGGESLTEAHEAARFNLPVLLLHGTGDIVTSHTASRAWFGKIASADKTHLELQDYFHEPHNDLGRDKPIAECIAWIEARVGGDARPSSAKL